MKSIEFQIEAAVEPALKPHLCKNFKVLNQNEMENPYLCGLQKWSCEFSTRWSFTWDALIDPESLDIKF